MTLFRQMFVALSIFLLTMLAGILAINFANAREYIEEELYIKAQNTASTLAVTMSQVDGDVTKMSIIADAVFDTGYYKEIVLKDMRGETIFEKVHDERPKVPHWFESMISLEKKGAFAQVSQGWRPLGILAVVSDTTGALEYLYSLFWKIVSIFLVAMLIGSILIVWLLRKILGPLRRMERQAEEVLEERFVKISDLPRTVELRHMTQAMNRLVERMEETHRKLLDLTAKNRELEYRDALTGLYNRKFVLAHYEEFVTVRKGWGVGVRVCGTEEANKRIGFDKVNGVIAEVGKEFAKLPGETEDRIVARISGTEFVWFGFTGTEEEIETTVRNFLKKIRKRLDGEEEIAQMLFLSVAVVEYDEAVTLEKFFASLDLALNSAMQENRDAWRSVRVDPLLPIRKSQWRTLLLDAMEKNRLTPNFSPLVTQDGTKRGAALFFDLLEEGERVPYRLFAPMMVQLNLFGPYMQYLFRYLDSEKDRAIERQIFVEIPLKDLDRTHLFDTWTDKIVEMKRHGLNVVITVKQNEMTRVETEVVERIVERLHDLGIPVTIGRFDAEPKMLEMMKRIRPTFVTVDIVQFRNMSDTLRDTMILLLNSLGVTLLLENTPSQKGDPR